MANTLTSNLSLRKPAITDTGWGATWNQNADDIDTLFSGAESGRLAVSRGGTGKNLSSSAQGGVPYFSATGVVSVLAAGTSGQALLTQGAGANPIWGAAGVALGDSPTWTGSHIWSVAGPQILSNADSQWLIGHSTDPGWSLAAIHVGARGALFGTTTFTFGSNVYTDGTEKYIATAAAGKIDINGDAISLRTAPSGTAGNAITWTQAIITADPGLVAIGRAGATNTIRLLGVGVSGTTDYDLTHAGSGTNLEGLAFRPTFQIKTGNHAGSIFGLNVLIAHMADGSARTIGDSESVYIQSAVKDANITITTARSLQIDNPTIGGTTNETIRASSGAILTTAGTWTNASSREYKNIIQYLDSAASYKVRKAEMVAMRPAMVQWKADHLIRPVRQLTAEIKRQYAREGLFQLEQENMALVLFSKKFSDLIEIEKEQIYTDIQDKMTLDQLNSKGISTDARWNGPVLETYRFNRWEIVGTDCKPMDLVLIAEELPEICRTKSGKGLDTAAVAAWLLEICKAQQADIDKIAAATGVAL